MAVLRIVHLRASRYSDTSSRVLLVSFFLFNLVFFFYIFFSSRRRHTRYIGDCSSDVCSSDLDSIKSFSLIAFLSPFFLLANVEELHITVGERQTDSKETRSSIVSEESLVVDESTPNTRSEERRVGKESKTICVLLY